VSITFRSPSQCYWTAATAAWALSARRVPWLPPARLQRLQDRRVREIVAHACRTVPFYRRAMAERGLRPEDVRTVRDLVRLPLVFGSDVARNPEDFQSSTAAAGPVLAVWSSGSSGHVKQILWDRAAVFRVHASDIRRRDVMAAFLGRRRGFRVMVLARRGGTRDIVMAFVAAHAGLPSGLGTVEERASLADSFAHNLEILNRFEPDVVMGFSGYVGAMFRWAVSNGHPVHRPRVVWGGGEMLPEPDRRLMQESLGIAVIQSYQACEALRIGYQCEQRAAYHLHADQVAVRIVDADGRDVPPGTRGRIVVSNLINRGTVLLNYVIGDFGRFADAPCPCRRTLPALASIDGREDDFLVRPDGGVVHTAETISTLCAVPGVSRLQVVQQAVDRFRIQVEWTGGAEWTDVRAALERGLATLMGASDLAVDIQRATAIAPDAGGKFRIVVSHARRDAP
jgi:phenylacetate-CoA ligase